VDQSSIGLVPMTASLEGARAIAVFTWTALAVLVGAGLLIAGVLQALSNCDSPATPTR
jgi:hypothetical protein